MEYIWKRYGMNISPLHPIKEMIVNTPGKTLISKANHGYVFLKGISENSIEHQLASHSNLKIIYDSMIDINKIKNEYEHIVVAMGNNDVPVNLGIWNDSLKSGIRIAKLSGDFRVNAMTMWLNKNYARNGYAYLLPKSPVEAELVLAVSDIDRIDLDFYWKNFVKKECLHYYIRKTDDINYNIGYPDAAKLGNLYFVGNCGGMIDNFLGFGMIRAMESGILAARAIAGNLDFDKLMQPLAKNVKQLSEYRKMMNLLTNKDYDTDLAILRLPVIKHLVYNNPLYKARVGLLVPKIISTYKTYKKKLHSKRPDT
jgi:hypothetical protein